jgi:hypothetical protein
MLQTNSKYEVNSVFNWILFPTHGKLPAKKNCLLISALFNFRGKLTVPAQIQQKVKLFLT